ncbi:unnamed protein product [Laminaria digitata]
MEHTRRGGVLIIMHGRSRMTIYRPSHPYNAGTEHVGGFSPIRQASLAPSAKRREVFGDSHEGRAASYKDPLVRWNFLRMDDSVE